MCIKTIQYKEYVLSPVSVWRPYYTRFVFPIIWVCLETIEYSFRVKFIETLYIGNDKEKWRLKTM